MYILWTIVIGFIIGLLARFLMPGKDPAGFIVTTILGVVGAFVGTYLGQLLGMYESSEPAGLFMSVLGALLVLYVFKKFGRGKTINQN